MSIIFFLIPDEFRIYRKKRRRRVTDYFCYHYFYDFLCIEPYCRKFCLEREMNPYLAAWIPNLIFFPISIWITIKAIQDSQLFDVEKYKAFFMPLVKRFSRIKNYKDTNKMVSFLYFFKSEVFSEIKFPYLWIVC